MPMPANELTGAATPRPKGRELMTAWANWLEGAERAKVVPIGSRQKRQ